MTRAGVADVAAVVDQVARASVGAVDKLLRAGHEVPMPAVHMLCADLDAPYVGYLSCRPFGPGRDSASAVGLLGRLPSVLAATHLVVVWDYASLRAALEPSGGRAPTGVAVVAASFTEHVVRWHPYRAAADGHGRTVVEWGQISRHPGGLLPVPVEYLLSTWRRLIDDDVSLTVEMLERAGYRMRWAARS